MSNQNNTVVVLSKEQQLCDELQYGLNGFKVGRVADIEALNNAAKSADTRVIVLHICNSEDWMAFEIMKTGYAGLPCFVILEEAVEGEVMPQGDLQISDAMAVFTRNKTQALAALIQSSISNNNLGTGAERDSNVDLIKTLADISREIGRLHMEFTETAFRTLPQRKIGGDTRERLKNSLKKLQAITIAP